MGNTEPCQLPSGRERLNSHTDERDKYCVREGMEKVETRLKLSSHVAGRALAPPRICSLAQRESGAALKLCPGVRG
jgi:hypothetical protein